LTKKVLAIACLFVFSNPVFMQQIESEIQNLQFVNNGILFTDNFSSAIYLLSENKISELISSRGVGNHFTVSKDKLLLGVKIIDKNDLQQPAIYELKTGKLISLESKQKRCGQVSFSDSGEISYSVDDKLILLKNNSRKEFDLPAYSNLTPISPNGKFVAFNDNADQIFILNIEKNNFEKISDSEFGYFSPTWSPDSKNLMYSSLSGNIFVYNLESQKIYNLGEGFNPRWSEDSKQIIFYRKEISGGKLLNTDIFIWNSDSETIEQFTDTPEEFEIDPVFIDDTVIYINSAKSEIVYKSLAENIEIKKISVPKIFHKKISGNDSTENLNVLDIPYINQVYDTPDWFNGNWACGPTSAMMVIAYYKLLPKWDIFCSWPNGHYSSYGNYIADKYYFRQMDYSSAADDPNGNPGYGGYGYMWTGNYSPHSRIALYYKNHGLTSATYDSPPFSQAKEEILSNYPYTMCVELTSAGHIVVAHGFGNEEHTLVFNDAYGNKNYGYMNYYGKNAKYDWPGYNNGYQNLKQVYWCTTAHGNVSVAADTVVDDLQFENGFYLHTKSPSSMKKWKDKNYGYNNHFWYCYSNSGKNADTCFAVWKPNIPRDGYYEIRAYIPYSNSTSASYKIFHKEGLDSVWVNQKIIKDSWISLGIFPFEKGNAGYVRLGDFTGTDGEELVFDAIEWVYKNPLSVPDENIIVKKFVLYQNYPNPFNPSTTISFSIPSSTEYYSVLQNVTLKVYDILGNEVATLVDENKPAGVYNVQCIMNNTSSGVYFYTLKAGPFTETKKMLLMK